MLLTVVLLASASRAVAGDYDPIILPALASRSGQAPKLALFVPGGKVPINDYVPFLSSVQAVSSANMVGVIVHCGKLNLCDPLGQLDGLIADAVKAAGKASNTTFAPADTFVLGHSLGGVGARHYADTFNPTRKAAAFAGLALFGTQFNGDHEDFKGTLGYPMDLKAFPAPLLVLLGELDMVPVSHAALLYQQYATKLNAAERAAKPVIIIPGMDHSQFCSPFNVSGDLQPEITNDLATHYISHATAAWIDGLVSTSAAAASTASDLLATWVANSTKPITAAWISAHEKEASAFCTEAQHLVLGDLSVRNLRVAVTTVSSSAALEHHHTNYTRTASGLDVSIVAYPFYAQLSSWNPLDVFAPRYASAKDLSCKLISADRIAEQYQITGKFPQKAPPVPCAAVNHAAMSYALSSLGAQWPAAIDRFSRRGRNLTFAGDSSTFAGPQWVFVSSLSFNEGRASVSSPRLYSSITSSIYPGNFYCKVLSPAKAIEWVQTTSLNGRL